MAGVPFDILERLATPGATAQARRLIALEHDFDALKKSAQEFVTRKDSGLGSAEFRAWKSALVRGMAPTESQTPAALRRYRELASVRSHAIGDLSTILQNEVASARRNLRESAREFLPDYFVFAASDLGYLLPEKNTELPPRNSRTREQERHLLLYLQRLAAKNDTFGAFGPTSWGRTSRDIAGVRLEPQPGIDRRVVFLERWTAHALAAAMNADAETIASELCPRLNPNGALIGHLFVFTDSGETAELTPTELEFLQYCDGRTPVHALAMPEDLLRGLVQRRILISAMEVPPLDPIAFETLRKEVEQWREGPARERWLPVLNNLAQSATRFAASTGAEQRQKIVRGARQQMAQLTGSAPRGQRSLYAAANIVAEECFRECHFQINEDLLNEVVNDAAPWIDFWRDSYAFVASRVAGTLRTIFEKTPLRSGALPLPAFLRACEAAKAPLTGAGLPGIAHLAFQEIKAAFREQLRPQASAAEYELSRADCHLVRDRFAYEKFDEFTYPSLDLQLAASSRDAIAVGDYHWILSEVHPPPALLHHCMYWSCPDTPRLNRALVEIGGQSFHFGFFAADFTAHTTVRNFDALPELTTFVAPQRAPSRWRQVAPAQTEVYVKETTGDVRLRHAVSKEDIGSFARNWIIPLGFHPFQFGLAPHMPRLRCGRVIVQRQAWTVTAAELGSGTFAASDLILAIEKLRAAKGWPRFVYIRPSEMALRRSGAEGRDKDTKPVFIDLESYLFLEIFQRWLIKSGELEVTEMLPTPQDLWWTEPSPASGESTRRTFELRTLVVPRT